MIYQDYRALKARETVKQNRKEREKKKGGWGPSYRRRRGIQEGVRGAFPEKTHEGKAKHRLNLFTASENHNEETRDQKGTRPEWELATGGYHNKEDTWEKERRETKIRVLRRKEKKIERLSLF